MKKFCTLITCLMVIILFIPTTAQASVIEPITNIEQEIIYADGQYTISVTTIIEQENISIFATTSSKSVSKVYKIENIFGNTVATYTLNGKFTYDGTTATCTSATYSTSTDSSLWSFESATASKSGAKAIGNFTAKTLLQTVSDTITISCSKTGVIS